MTMSLDTITCYGWYGGSEERLTQVATYGWYDPGIILVGDPLDFFRFELHINRIIEFLAAIG